MSQRRVILTFSLLTALFAAGYGVMFTMLDDFRDEYGISEGALGMVVAVGFFASFASQVFFAPLADRGHAATAGLHRSRVQPRRRARHGGRRHVPAAVPVAAGDGHRHRHRCPSDPPHRDPRRSGRPRSQHRPLARCRRRRLRARAGHRGRADRSLRDCRTVPRHRRGNDRARSRCSRESTSRRPRPKSSPTLASRSICCASGRMPARSASAPRSS